MANAWPPCQESNLRTRVPRIDAEGRRSFCPLCGLERSILRCICHLGGCRVRRVLRTVRTNRSAGSDDHSNGAKTRLLLFVAVRSAFVLTSVDGDAGSAHRPGHHHRRVASSPISVRRGRKKLATAPDCCSHNPACCRYTCDLHPSRRIYAMEPGDERLEQ